MVLNLKAGLFQIQMKNGIFQNLYIKTLRFMLNGNL